MGSFEIRARRVNGSSPVNNPALFLHLGKRIRNQSCPNGIFKPFIMTNRGKIIFKKDLRDLLEASMWDACNRSQPRLSTVNAKQECPLFMWLAFCDFAWRQSGFPPPPRMDPKARRWASPCPSEKRFLSHPEFVGQARVEPVHQIERRVAAEPLRHIEIAHVKAAPEQRQIHLGMVVREAGAPDPRISRRVGCGSGHEGGAALQGEVGAVETASVGGQRGFLCAGSGRGGCLQFVHDLRNLPVGERIKLSEHFSHQHRAFEDDRFQV